MDAETQVELVDVAGRAIGTSGKRGAHDRPGRLHRAFSVFLLDATGRLILQRRAAGKYHSAGLWSNTCCGHPAPGEDPRLAASRRLSQELGLVVAPHDLAAAGVITYRVADPVSGLVEWEFDHLFVGRAAGPVAPNAAEVAEVGTASLDELAPPETGGPEFTAWFPIVLAAAMAALRRTEAALTTLPEAEAALTTLPEAEAARGPSGSTSR